MKIFELVYLGMKASNNTHDDNKNQCHIHIRWQRRTVSLTSAISTNPATPQDVVTRTWIQLCCFP